MKLFRLIILSLFFTVKCATSEEPKEEYIFFAEGNATWYGKSFHGKRTASGDIFDTAKHTAAHKTLPFGTIVKVTNLNNNIAVLVEINDRGPFHKSRIIDLSESAARQIDMIDAGVTKVKLEILQPTKLTKE